MSALPTSPNLLPDSESALDSLASAIHDWQFAHGSLLKFPPRSGETLAYPIGVALAPTRFPRRYFEEAMGLQEVWGRLYASAAAESGWVRGAVENVMGGADDEVEAISIGKVLWDIHCQVREEGYAQDLEMGIWRSDYMLHSTDLGPLDAEVGIRQVEFNTYSLAGGVHSNTISRMHEYLARTRAYTLPPNEVLDAMPKNETTSGIADALCQAHRAYGPLQSELARQTGILMLVQPNNINVCDERPIEYACSAQDVPLYRVDWGEEALNRIKVTPSRALLFRPGGRRLPSGASSESPSESNTSFSSSQPVEISVIYHRAGYDPEEYDKTGRYLRYQLERSRAIKCPSILSHLTTLKVVQQCLSQRDHLSHFLGRAEVERVLKVCMRIYPLDDSAAGLEGRKLATDEESARDYVLKPSLEGGGHNVFGEEIPHFLKEKKEEEWKAFVLMEAIQPPEVDNALMMPQGTYEGSVISELGVFGAVMWRRGESEVEVVKNETIGFSFKTKARQVDEMSVVKGFGCFDSPFLV